MPMLYTADIYTQARKVTKVEVSLRLARFFAAASEAFFTA